MQEEFMQSSKQLYVLQKVQCAVSITKLELNSPKIQLFSGFNHIFDNPWGSRKKNDELLALM